MIDRSKYLLIIGLLFMALHFSFFVRFYVFKRQSFREKRQIFDLLILPLNVCIDLDQSGPELGASAGSHVNAGTKAPRTPELLSVRSYCHLTTKVLSHRYLIKPNCLQVYLKVLKLLLKALVLDDCLLALKIRILMSAFDPSLLQK